MNQINVEYLTHMGDDCTIVNSARVSMGKQVVKFNEETDTKLIRYLAKHKHESPFFHATAQFRVKVPIFIERQIFKHQVGFSYNSISMRYVEPPNEFYRFDKLRKGSPSIKQGSLDEVVENEENAQEKYKLACLFAFNTYNKLLLAGVCKEQARAVLPMSTMTEFIVTGSLAAWARMYNLRSKPDAQREVQEYARQVGQHMLGLFPVSWKVLTNQEQKEDK